MRGEVYEGVSVDSPVIEKSLEILVYWILVLLNESCYVISVVEGVKGQRNMQLKGQRARATKVSYTQPLYIL